MEALKERADAAFRQSNYTEALKLYSSALELQPRNTTLLNNRSATYHKLGQYGNALDDANKSTGVEATARGYQRVGNAYWSLGRFEQAVMAFERSLELGPSDQVRADLAEVRRLAEAGASGSTSGHSTPTPMATLYLNIGVVLMSIVHAIAMLLSPPVSVLAWKGAVILFGLRQLDTVRPSLKLSRDALSRLASVFAFQWLILAAVLLITGSPPQLLLLLAMCIYAGLEIRGSRHLLRTNAALETLERWAGSYLDKLGERPEQYVAQAAMCEVMTGIMFPLSGGGMMGMLLVWQFLKFRYNSDAVARLAFAAIADGLGKIFYHRLCPAPVGGLFTKFKGLLHRLATN